MSSIGAVIIAAGSSSRLGQPKQLLKLNGEMLLQRAIRIAQQSGLSPVLVVLGAHRRHIESQIDFSGASIIVNGEWEEGMASSIRFGIEALKKDAPEAQGVLLMICDQPAVTAEHLCRMLDAFRQHPAGRIASVYASRRGIPAIFPLQAFPDLLALRGDHGARGLLADKDCEVFEIPLDGGELDIDRPEDLAGLQPR